MEDSRRNRKKVSVVVKILSGLILLCVICIVGYVIYMQANYYRIEDHAVLEAENNQKK